MRNYQVAALQAVNARDGAVKEIKDNSRVARLKYMVAESKFARAYGFDFCNAFSRRECGIIFNADNFSVGFGICAETDFFARDLDIAAVYLQAVGEIAAQYAVNVINVSDFAVLNAVSNGGITNRRESPFRHSEGADFISLNRAV